MRKMMYALVCLMFFASNSFAQQIYEYEFNANDAKVISMSEYKGKVILIVNTASKCGYTGQYEGLETLYQKHKDKGLEIIAFPCNQFLNQEPGTDEEIQSFCTSKYNITFPIAEKIEVNGPNTYPLYIYLKNTLKWKSKIDVKWNFEKFLIDRNGVPVKRYPSSTKPEEIEADIMSLLETK